MWTHFDTVQAFVRLRHLRIKGKVHQKLSRPFEGYFLCVERSIFVNTKTAFNPCIPADWILTKTNFFVKFTVLNSVK